MHTTVELLDAACAKLGGITDYRLAKELGVRQQTVSNWRTGTRTIGNDHALGLARILEIDPVYVIACASAERAEAGARQEWLRMAGRVQGAGRKIASLLRHAAAACVVLGAGIFGSGGSSGAPAGAPMAEVCILRQIRRPRTLAALASPA